jgi:hypothetical protein
MNGKFPMPVSGNPASKGAPDGVSEAPGGNAKQVHGRTVSGESGGGAYPNPHRCKTNKNDGYMGHGGQTEINYHGGGQAGEQGLSAPNAATGSGGSDRETTESSRSASQAGEPRPPAPREVGNGIAVIEVSGVAEAESSGKVATDAPYEEEQKQPGSG